MPADISDGVAATEEDDEEPVAPPSRGFELDAPPGFAVGLEGIAGIALEWVSGDKRPHGIVGGLARLSFQYVQAGASIEVSDSAQAKALNEEASEHFRAIGGFVGARLPYRRWIDLDLSLGLESKQYENPDSIYGPSGYDVAVTALSLRAGISDRSTEKEFGARVGAGIVGTVDLQNRSPVWTRTYVIEGGGLGHLSGTTPVGGVTVALVIAIGLEAGGGSPRH